MTTAAQSPRDEKGGGTQTDRQEMKKTDRDREKRRKRNGERWIREREENSNSKTLILKDSSVRSIWTYLTGSSCYTTNTNKHDYNTNRYYKYE